MTRGFFPPIKNNLRGLLVSDIDNVINFPCSFPKVRVQKFCKGDNLMKRFQTAVVCFGLCSILSSFIFAQNNAELNAYSEPPSRLRGVIENFDEDYGALNRFYSAQTSPNRLARFRQLYADYLSVLGKTDFDTLNHDEQIDHLLFKNYLDHEQKELARFEAQLREMSALIPFARTISELEDSRRRLETLDSARAAGILNVLAKQIIDLQKDLENNKANWPKRTVANRAARTVAGLRSTLRNWNTFYTGYDPEYTWWTAEPYKAVDGALEKYQAFLLDKMVGIKPDDRVTIIGDPIGRQGLMEELEFERIPYTPEELIELANKEFAWCEAEMKKASTAMGYGDDWKKALEIVKQKYVEPGKQAALIRLDIFLL